MEKDQKYGKNRGGIRQENEILFELGIVGFCGLWYTIR